MIPIFDDDGNRLAHTYNGLTLNSLTAATNPNGPGNLGYEITSIVPLTQLDSISDPHQGSDGMESYEVRKVAKVYRIDGIIRATSIAKLFDMMKELAAKFDPAKVSHENPDTMGYLPYKFSVPTTDTDNYASGFVPSQIYFRARACPEPVVSSFTGLTASFTLEMVARDPRRYLQTASSINDGSGGDLDNSLADYRSWPTLTIEMGGAGSATATWSAAGTTLGSHSLVLDLSGCTDGDEIVVDFEHRRILKNDTETPSLYVSGTFWEVEPESINATASNQTNVSSWTIEWRKAFCL